MTAQPQLQMDNATFLDWVQGREERCELAGGRVVTLPRGTLRHARIVGNLLQTFGSRLGRKQWDVLTDFGIDIRPGTLRYADIVADRYEARGDTLTTKTPVLIAEVLSPLTTKLDLGDKVTDYLQLPSLGAYLILNQDEIKAWAYTRVSGSPFSTGPQVLDGADASISIPVLNVELPLVEIYEGIEFG